MFSLRQFAVKAKPLVPGARTIFTTFKTGEVGAWFTLGKFSGISQPGPTLYFPGLQKFVRVNTQITTHNLEKMHFPVKGGASVEVGGFVEYKVVDPEKYVSKVRDGDSSLLIRCGQIVREEISAMSISDILSKKGQLNKVLVDRVSHLKDDWGMEVTQIQVTDFSFDESVKRTMTMRTEAEQTAFAKKTIADADKDVAKTLKETSDILENTATMKLRELSSLERMASHGNMIIVVPTNSIGSNELQTLTHSSAIAKAVASNSSNVSETEKKLHGYGQP
ncbi:MAG: hypothetical protein Terrestrivirus1_232 [Terrestrivirus sp.]|uniref:Band 7 domain-containing protein n=1 Tax=Terrestrivirus sp. TaxID=2487775 RepID=A0A3G4ZKI9_9VIRU|nr:MAG: hypothetical protein Terrestrivirus1_232 [Terrestrivirus sp.]